MKINEKQVIIVRGSEDGNLGVFTNVKAAYAKAIHYLTHGQPTMPVNGSYGEACKEISRIGYYALTMKQTEVTLETFYLNN